MSTPTPSASHLAGKTLNQGHTATPPSQNHLGSFTSPLPRSVPSPAAHRTQAGKSPFAPSTSGPPTSHTMAIPQNHPTGSSTHSGGAGALNFDSPSAALGINLPEGVGGFNMLPSMSGMSGIGGLQMGLGTSMGGRGTDEEVRKRLDAVLSIVGSRSGRAVDREGIGRLAKRFGLDCEFDKNSGIIAGKTLAIDIDTDSSGVPGFVKQSNWVRLSIEMSESFNAYADSASAVLQRDLTPPPGVDRINITLEKFAKNLENLARLDKLSTPGVSVNCYDAIAGVYSSLKRLYEHEKQAALTILGTQSEMSERKATREVLCKRSGRPRMNSDQRIGLSVEYWMDRRHVFLPSERSGKPNPKGKDNTDPNKAFIEDVEDNNVFSLMIDCEPCLSQLYNPVRVSNDWISDAIEKSPEDPDGLLSGSTIDWQDPPPTYILEDSTKQPETLAMDGTTVRKLPNVRFVARLNPPITMPLTVAAQILHSVNHNVQHDPVRAATYEDLLLKPDASEDELTSLTMATELTKQFTQSRMFGNPEVQHVNTLYIQKPELGKVLEEFPFEHPRQLIGILPTLRQYAQVNTLLKDSFFAGKKPAKSLAINGASEANGIHSAGLSMPVTISLIQSSPSPQLALVFPYDSNETPSESASSTGNEPSLDDIMNDEEPQAPQSQRGNVSISLEVQPNGDLAGVEVEVSDDSSVTLENEQTTKMEVDDDNKDAKIIGGEQLQRLVKALDVAGDLGIWVEWVRSMKELDG